MCRLPHIIDAIEPRSIVMIDRESSIAVAILMMYVLFFLSGFTSLIFQVLWLRGFSLILGSTIYAMACVVTAFMMGLAVGSYGVSQLLERVPKSVKWGLCLYGIAELIIGVSAATISYSLFRNANGYIRWLSSFTDAQPSFTVFVAHFVFAILLLAIPTVFMGSTLPLLATALSDRKKLPRLYGINTIGAAVGALTSSFVLIYYFGCIRSALLVGATNGFIFITALFLQWRRPHCDQGGPWLREIQAAAISPNSFGPVARHLPWLMACISGFSVLAAEISWHRYLSLFLGNRIYVTSITLFLVLYFLGFAARLSHRLMRRYPPLVVVIVACAVTICCLSVGFVLEPSAMLSILSPPGSHSLVLKVAAVGFIVFAIILPVTASGIIFPVAMTLCPPKETNYEAWIGKLYAANTLAAILGSLLAGYWLIGTLGSHGILVLVSALFCLLLTLLVRHCDLKLRKDLRILEGVCYFCLLASLPFALNRPQLFGNASTVLVEEDAHGLFTVARVDAQRLRVLQNNTDLVFLYGDDITQFVQETQAYLPLTFSPHLHSVLNIGVGYGITAGAMARFPGVESVDAVEIVPAMLAHAALFADRNYRYFENPKIKPYLNDGRHFLAMSSRVYDVISINVSDPYLPGSASLFSDEFYELAKAHLAQGGVFCQHLFGPDVGSLFQGLKRHFTSVKIFPAYRNGITVIASDEPLVAHQKKALDEAVTGSTHLFARLPLTSADQFLTLIDKGDSIVERLSRTPASFINSDSEPELEFRRLDGINNLLFSNH